MALKICQIIYSDTEKEIFRFPKHTLLDNIPFDLWNDILKYKYCYFRIGHNEKEYDGFRKMTKADITNDFKNEFIKNINQKLDMHELGNVSACIVLIDECYLLINGSKFYFLKKKTRMKMHVNECKIEVKEYFSHYRKCSNIETIDTSTIFRQSNGPSGYATFFIPII